MVLSPELEAQILHRYHVGRCKNGTIARQLKINPGTVGNFLGRLGLQRMGTTYPSQIDDHLPFIHQTLEKLPTLAASRLHSMVREHGYRGGASHFRHVIANFRPRFDASEWMIAVLQKKIESETLRYQIDDIPELDILLHHVYTGRLFDRNKALAMLAYKRGLPIKTISNFLAISTNTYSCYKRLFLKGGCQALFSRKANSTKKSDDEALKSEIFKVLHQPPSNYGINRTSWTMPLLRKVLKDNGKAACPEVIRSITWASGYRWRKARVTLTSTDRNYSEKLNKIHLILSNLKSDELFFSIDEYGPFAVKMYGGRKLVSPSEHPVVPQWQKSRGSLMLTAALDLFNNQITHFYSNKKNTVEMIKMMTVLKAKYANKRKIYLSWDAASWHISKQLNREIDEQNINAS